MLLENNFPWCFVGLIYKNYAPHIKLLAKLASFNHRQIYIPKLCFLFFDILTATKRIWFLWNRKSFDLDEILLRSVNMAGIMMQSEITLNYSFILMYEVQDDMTALRLHYYHFCLEPRMKRIIVIHIAFCSDIFGKKVCNDCISITWLLKLDCISDIGEENEDDEKTRKDDCK